MTSQAKKMMQIFVVGLGHNSGHKYLIKLDMTHNFM